MGNPTLVSSLLAALAAATTGVQSLAKQLADCVASGGGVTGTVVSDADAKALLDAANALVAAAGGVVGGVPALPINPATGLPYLPTDINPATGLPFGNPAPFATHRAFAAQSAGARFDPFTGQPLNTVQAGR